MSNPLGTFDPDGDEFDTSKVPAWSKSKNEFQRKALSVCGRKSFKSSMERKRWNALEDKTFGGEERHIMYKAWMEHNVELCAQANGKAPVPVRNFGTLMAMIENENRRVDWASANRDKVMASRASAVKSRFGRQSDD